MSRSEGRKANKEKEMMESEDLEKRMRDLLQRRKELLQGNPRLQRLQQQIDQKLKSLGDDPTKRLKYLNGLIRENIDQKLLPALEELNQSFQQWIEDNPTLQKAIGENEELARRYQMIQEKMNKVRRFQKKYSQQTLKDSDNVLEMTEEKRNRELKEFFAQVKVPKDIH